MAMVFCVERIYSSMLYVQWYHEYHSYSRLKMIRIKMKLRTLLSIKTLENGMPISVVRHYSAMVRGAKTKANDKIRASRQGFPVDGSKCCSRCRLEWVSDNGAFLRLTESDLSSKRLFYSLFSLIRCLNISIDIFTHLSAGLSYLYRK